jgi:hypothetical protein
LKNGFEDLVGEEIDSAVHGTFLVDILRREVEIQVCKQITIIYELAPV